MQIKVMIAEDEYLAREELIYLLEKEKEIILCPSAETGEELVDLYFEHKPDVLFLDIEMPGITGVEAAKQIMKFTSNTPLFVFTTAYDAYAIDAFEIEAVDYLLKPFDQGRLHQAVERIKKRLLDKKEIELPNTHPSSGKLLIDDGEKMIVLSPDSIYYAVPSQRMLEIHTENDVIESKMTLQELEKKLEGLSFFRTHRSYLVNLNHILEITPWFNGAYNITLKNKEKTTIPVSRSARKALFERFGH
ncbi:LytTR family DNA-binding domain-containing protein [Pseudogracilibacillus sp. SE30717A]|uniref:LytR/AlgR family response regulator transcription factor n=1 Tax=Pseudogracilibacillus sp. SE30717A TaxID=3098293 RepID=UPI00300E3D4D